MFERTPSQRAERITSSRRQNVSMGKEFKRTEELAGKKRARKKTVHGLSFT